jgi:hypothetical protein
LVVVKLPTRQVHGASPHDSYLPAVTVNRDRLVTDWTEPQCGDQATLRSLAIAWGAGAPARAMLDLGGINPEEAQTFAGTAKRVAVNNVGT